MEQKTALIVQARMGSKRLPGKVLKEVLGKPLLEYQIERLSKVRLSSQLIVATTSLDKDDPIALLCEKMGVAVFRGSEKDVLSRYYEAATEVGAEVIVRVTADCPLIDPKLVDEVIERFLFLPPKVDYASNCLERTFPVGMDTEVFSYDTLKSTWKLAKKPEEREHVTLYMYRGKSPFSVANVANIRGNQSDVRLTVDTPEDFKRVEDILTKLYPFKQDFGLDDILEVIHE